MVAFAAPPLLDELKRCRGPLLCAHVAQDEGAALKDDVFAHVYMIAGFGPRHNEHKTQFEKMFRRNVLLQLPHYSLSVIIINTVPYFTS